jgi:hypothetical protein
VRISFFLTTLVIAGAAGIQAGVITFASNGTAADPLEYQTYGATLAIVQHPVWAAPLPGSSWVSYGITGDQDTPNYFMPANGTVVSFFQSFSIPMLSNVATVTFRADDSAALYVNGKLVVPEAPSAGNQYSICSDLPVGCLVKTQMTANIAPYLVAGTNVLRFDLAQRNSYSFGLNYAGYASWAETTVVVQNPEPASFAMLGVALIAIGFWRRKPR